MTIPRITARKLGQNDFQPSLLNSFIRYRRFTGTKIYNITELPKIWRGGTILTVPGTFPKQTHRPRPNRGGISPYRFFYLLLHHGFQVGIGFRPDGRPAGSDRTARRLDPARLQT